MAKRIVKPQTNIRSSKDITASANVIATSADAPLMLEIPDAVDGWHEVTFKGYVRADRVVPAPVDSDATNLPYYSQRGIGRNNACGLASVASMIEKATRTKVDVAKLSKQFDVRQDGTTSDDLIRAALSYGVQLESFADKDQIPDRLPAIVLHYYRWNPKDTQYRFPDGSSFTGLHWAVLLAYDNDEIVMHDPLWLGNGGAFKRYPIKDWLSNCYKPVNGSYWWLSYAIPGPRAALRRAVAPFKNKISPRNDKLITE